MMGQLNCERIKQKRAKQAGLAVDTIYPEHEVIALERKRSAGRLTLRVTPKSQRSEVVREGEHR